MKNAFVASSWVVLIICASATTVAAGGVEPVVESPWKSLGGNFRRTGLSENFGPETGCVKWKFETDGAVSRRLPRP